MAGAIDPTDIVEVLVALDGSAAAERSLRPAQRLAARLGVAIRLLEVVERQGDAGLAHRYLAGVARRSGARSWTVLVGADPAEALTAAAGRHGRIVSVVASRGRHSSGRLLGSVAVGVVGRTSAATVLVGPAAGEPAGGGPVVAVAARNEHALRAGAAWALGLGSELVIVPPMEVDRLLAALLEFRASLIVVDHGEQLWRTLGEIVDQAPCPVLVLPRSAAPRLPNHHDRQTMVSTGPQGRQP